MNMKDVNAGVYLVIGVLFMLSGAYLYQYDGLVGVIGTGMNLFGFFCIFIMMPVSIVTWLKKNAKHGTIDKQ